MEARAARQPVSQPQQPGERRRPKTQSKMMPPSGEQTRIAVSENGAGQNTALPALKHSVTLVNGPGVPPRQQGLRHGLGEERAQWMLRDKRRGPGAVGTRRGGGCGQCWRSSVSARRSSPVAPVWGAVATCGGPVGNTSTLLTAVSLLWWANGCRMLPPGKGEAERKRLVRRRTAATRPSFCGESHSGGGSALPLYLGFEGRHAAWLLGCCCC